MKHFYACLVGATLLLTAHLVQAQAPTPTVKYIKDNEKEVPASEAKFFVVQKEDSLGGGTRTRFEVGTNRKVSLATYTDINGGRYGNGILHGPFYEWHENGRLATETAYRNDSLTGNYTTWYESGQLHVSRKYYRNQPVDTLKAFYESGALRRLEVYADGEITKGRLYGEDGTELKFIPMMQMPTFPGGEKVMLKWLSMNVRYPKATRKARAEGIVIISFVVEKTGQIGNIDLIKGFHPDADAEALRVVHSMPVWKPGLLEGEPSPVRYTLPIRFAML